MLWSMRIDVIRRSCAVAEGCSTTFMCTIIYVMHASNSTSPGTRGPLSDREASLIGSSTRLQLCVRFAAKRNHRTLARIFYRGAFGQKPARNHNKCICSYRLATRQTPCYTKYLILGHAGRIMHGMSINEVMLVGRSSC